MNLIEELKSLGVDVDDGLNRVMGDNSLYEMMLGMFIDAVNEKPVNPEDFDSGNLDEVIARIHMLKGVTGNLAMTPLFTAYTNSLQLLRAGQPREAKAIFEQLLPVQSEILACIKRHMNAQ